MQKVVDHFYCIVFVPLACAAEAQDGPRFSVFHVGIAREEVGLNFRDELLLLGSGGVEVGVGLVASLEVYILHLLKSDEFNFLLFYSKIYYL